MFTKALATLSVAIVVAISGSSLLVTAAEAHRPATPSIQTDEVWVGNEFVGRDSDPNVRLDLLRTYGQTGG